MGRTLNQMFRDQLLMSLGLQIPSLGEKTRFKELDPGDCHLKTVDAVFLAPTFYSFFPPEVHCSS